ncbi:MAG: hypothetical protein UZ22_OP11002000085 [Microgenomates bacterium OLB23]|nr:MAG: hypothetical protein UZ22_OP11002000085 [Microgenomates bacterium OLB23]
MKKVFLANFIHIFSKKLLIYVPSIGLLFVYVVFACHKLEMHYIFLHAQSSFGAQRTSEIILLPQVIVRYIKIFFTAQPNYQYFIAVTEFIFFVGVFVAVLLHVRQSIKRTHTFELGIALFSFANLLLPTLTGTFSSIPRYSLFALSTFFLLYRATPQIRVFCGIAFFLLQCLLFALFTQGYFVS